MRYSVFLLSIFLLNACNNRQQDPYKNNLGVDEKYVAAIDTAHYTLINWVDTVINVGNITEGDTAFANFKFRNSGETPLFILGVKPSCGCTIVDYPRNSLASGDSKFIKAKFGTSHMRGFARKTILVTTNTRNGGGKTLLTIEANVLTGQ
jgi:hypothetical protein